MDINFIQETIDSLRTLTQQNGALTRQNSQLINEVAKEFTLNSAKEEILTAVENTKPEVDLSRVAQESTLQQVKNAVENIELPEIDTSAIAKQGENAEATNSKILEEVAKETTLRDIAEKLNHIPPGADPGLSVPVARLVSAVPPELTSAC